MGHNQPRALHVVDIQETHLNCPQDLGHVLIILAPPLVPYDNTHMINIGEQNE